MRNTLLAIAGATLLLALVVWVALGPGSSGPGKEAPPPPPPEPTRVAGSTTSIPIAHPPGARPDAGQVAVTPPPPALPPPPLPDAVNPLRGVSMVTLDDGARARLKVPQRYGKGVLLTEVDPTSPAAESALKADDVIVRAQRIEVNGPEDLQRAVAERDHIVLIVARDGELFEVVLHRPSPD